MPGWRPGHPIPEKQVRPVIPRNPEYAKELREDLTRMGCEAFLDLPWDLSNADMLNEIALKRQAKELSGSDIRSRPENWTAEHWRITYGFPVSNNSWDNTKGDPKLRKRFTKAPHNKSGYSVEDCKISRDKRMLEFMVPIMSPDKPTNLTTKLAQTIFEAYSGRRVTGWGLIIEEIVLRELRKLGCVKGCPVTPFIYHLYATYSQLTTKEKEKWKESKEICRSDSKVGLPEQEGEEFPKDDLEATPRQPVKRARRMEISEEEREETETPEPARSPVQNSSKRRKLTPVYGRGHPDNVNWKKVANRGEKGNEIRVRTRGMVQAELQAELQKGETDPEVLEVRNSDPGSSTSWPQLNHVLIPEAGFNSKVKEALALSKQELEVAFTALKEVGKVILTENMVEFPEKVKALEREAEEFRKKHTEQALMILELEEANRQLKATLQAQEFTRRSCPNCFGQRERPDQQVKQSGKEDEEQVEERIRKYVGDVEAAVVQLREIVRERH